MEEYMNDCLGCQILLTIQEAVELQDKEQREMLQVHLREAKTLRNTAGDSIRLKFITDYANLLSNIWKDLDILEGP